MTDDQFKRSIERIMRSEQEQIIEASKLSPQHLVERIRDNMHQSVKMIAQHHRDGDLTELELTKLTAQEMAEFEREYANSLDHAEPIEQHRQRGPIKPGKHIMFFKEERRHNRRRKEHHPLQEGK